MFRKKLKLFVVVIICVCVAFTYISYANTGDENDPVISLSYLTEVFKPEITNEFTFEVVSLEAGQTLLCSKGAELILRMGKADVVATPKGGLADVTAGTDLGDKELMPANHLLIVPVNDGRGVKAVNDCLIMVKGKYEIK